MSAFAVIYERSNTPVQAGVLERVMERLKHRGPDGSDGVVSGHIAMGHWHFWTTPEEVEERQPLQLSGLPFKIVLDGRLDNRPELISDLKLDSTQGKLLSDAVLILHAYDRWGENCFEHFVGEYALVLLDQQRDELICARDALGDRTLFYATNGTRMVIASEPWAVAGADNSGIELNESTVAHFFSRKAIEDGQTFFKGIYELPPAHVMVSNASGDRHWRYWHPDSSKQLHGKSNEGYAEQFRLLLEESVRCRLRSTTPVGVQMSGGLDSPSVACLAARMLAPVPLTTISYVFDELTDCDERQYIETVKARWGIRSIQLPGDDAWPLKNWQEWPVDPGRPERNAYRLLFERVYQRAQQEGLRVLLTGAFGDHLYGGGQDWLAELILEGRLLEAARELSIHIRYAGLAWTLRAGFLQRVVRRLLNTLPGGRYAHRRGNTPDWLTYFSIKRISKLDIRVDPAFERDNALLGMEAAQGSSSEIFYASRYALEVRHPYRDRRLVEFVLAIPAYQLYYRGLYKHILRSAMQGILPEPIRNRQKPTALTPLFLRGMQREKNTLETCLRDPDAAWRKFVRPERLLEHWEGMFSPEKADMELLTSWLCISYEKWFNNLSCSN